MPIIDSLLAPLVSIIDKVIPDPAERDKAKLELLQMQGTQQMQQVQTELSASLPRPIRPIRGPAGPGPVFST